MADEARGKTKLADAYVQIIPVTKDIKSSLEKLFGAAPQEGEKAGKKTGESFMSKLKSTVMKLATTVSIGALFKKSFEEGAALEQSLGGVETLFKEHADIVKRNAQEAYKTAGLSANEYMENVTSFSASLLSSLSGDTEKAAKVADMAMVDMSDNANKFGTDMQSIQNAYQGFAKQNYTMLDNLKLGYGGTKEEMQRLLADAQKLSGVKYNIENLSDVYNAIHVIQTELDVTGTTSKEAASTFSGSFASMKAAAKNFLGVLTAGGDAGEAFSSLTNTTGTFFKNVKRMLNTAEKQIDDLFYSITDNIGITKNGADGLKVAIEALIASTLTFAAISKFTQTNEALATMSVKTAIVTAKNKALNGVLTTQASLATKASLAMGAAVVAGEAIGWLITDVWDPAGVNDMADSFGTLSDETADFRDKCDEIAQSITDLNKEASKGKNEAKKQADNYKTLKDRLFELDEAEQKSTADKAEMQDIVTQLNEGIDGLNLSIDSQSGSLVNNKNVVDKMIGAYEKMSVASSLQDKLAEATRNAEDAQSKYTEAVERYNQAKADGVDKYSDEMLALSMSVNELHAASETANSDLQEIKDSIADAQAAQEEFSRGFGDSSQYIANLSEDTLNSIQGICEKYQEAYQTEYDLVYGQMNLLDEFCGKSDVTKDTLMANLQDNIDGFTEWEDNLSILKSKVSKGIISEDFYNNLEEMGPKGAGYAKAFVDMSDKELKQYSTKSKTIFEEMDKYVEKKMQKMKDTSAKQLDELIDLPDQKKDDIKVAYAMLGNYATEGYADGIKNGSDNMNAAVRQAIQDAIDTAKDTQDSHSPSRIFKKLGGYASEGYAFGITDEADKAVKASSDMVKRAINTASSFSIDPAVTALKSSVTASYRTDIVADSQKAENNSILSKIITLLETYFPQLAQQGNIYLDGDKITSKMDGKLGERVTSSERRLASV